MGLACVLPEEVLHHTFEYLTLDDLLHLSTTSRLWLDRVSTITRHAEVVRPSQIHVALARRFPKLHSLFITCFVSVAQNEDEEASQSSNDRACSCGEFQTVCSTVVHQATFFLAEFRQLKKVRFCGSYCCTCDNTNNMIEKHLAGESYSFYYDPDSCVTPGHGELLRHLLTSIAGGFASGALSRTIKSIQGLRCPFATDGLFLIHRDTDSGTESESPPADGCETCQYLIDSVPVHLSVETPASFCGWQQDAGLVPDLMICMSEKCLFQRQYKATPGIDCQQWALNLLSCLDATSVWFGPSLSLHPEILDVLGEISKIVKIDQQRATEAIQMSVQDIKEARTHKANDNRFSRDCFAQLASMGISLHEGCIELS